MNISDEAVEAAREQLDAMGVSVSKKYMRSALEAAAPQLIAKVWEEGYDAGFTFGSFERRIEEPVNPYRWEGNERA